MFRVLLRKTLELAYIAISRRPGFHALVVMVLDRLPNIRRVLSRIQNERPEKSISIRRNEFLYDNLPADAKEIHDSLWEKA
jgi:hypothetical protein